MSNTLAIATATATFTAVLQAAIDVDFGGGAKARPVRPDHFTNGGGVTKGISVFLYQVTPNPAWRNHDLQTRRPDGTLAQTATAALDLHYLLTFFGDDMQYEPQRMLGSIVSAIHARPVLTRDRINSAIAAAVGLDPSSFLGKSDLANQLDTVRFTPHPLSLEEMSRLWSVFFQIPYSLSVLYEASVVLVDGKEVPKPAPPVQSRKIVAVPIAIPAIAQITPQILEFSPVANIVIAGQNLAARPAVVKFGDLESTPDDSANDSSMSVALPPGIQAGVRTAQVVNFYDLGAPSGSRKAFESNLGVFILQPKLGVPGFAKPAGIPTVTLPVTPPIGPRQQVMLLLNEQPPFIGPEPLGFQLRAGDRGAPVSSLDFPVTGVPPATYFVRLQVDGAENNMNQTVTVT
jgi:hypothetical protein